MDIFFKRKHALSHYITICEEMDRANDARAEEQEKIINKQKKEIKKLQKLVDSRLEMEHKMSSMLERTLGSLEEDREYIAELKEEITELDSFINANFNNKQKDKHRMRARAVNGDPLPVERVLFVDENKTPPHSGPWCPYTVDVEVVDTSPLFVPPPLCWDCGAICSHDSKCLACGAASRPDRVYTEITDASKFLEDNNPNPNPNKPLSP